MNEKGEGILNDGIIIERLENIKQVMELQGIENKNSHNEIIKRQDHTNGDVTKLKLWRAYLLGAWIVIASVSTVLLPLLGYYFFQSIRYEMREENKTLIDQAILRNNEMQFKNFNK